MAQWHLKFKIELRAAVRRAIDSRFIKHKELCVFFLKLDAIALIHYSLFLRSNKQLFPVGNSNSN